MSEEKNKLKLKKIKYETWVDFVEGELDPDLSQDLSRLAQSHSELGRDVKKIENLRSVLKGLPEESNVHLENEILLQNLHSRIMKGVGETRVQPKFWVKIANQDSLRYAAAVVVLIVGGLVSKSLIPTTRSVESQNTRTAMLNELMMETTAQNPQVLEHSVLTHEDEIDLFMDMAAARMKSQTDRENAQLLKTLRE